MMMMMPSIHSPQPGVVLAPYNQHFPATPGLRPIQWPPTEEVDALRALPPEASLPDGLKPWLTVKGRPYDRLNRHPLPDLPLEYISHLGPHLPHHGMAQTYPYHGSSLPAPLPAPMVPVTPLPQLHLKTDYPWA